MSDTLGIFADHWLLGVICIGLLFFIIGAILRTAIKFAGVALIIGIILLGTTSLRPSDVIHKGKLAVNGLTALYNHNSGPLSTKETDKARPNGVDTIQTPNIKVSGKNGDKEITIYFNGNTYHIKTDMLSKIIREKIDSTNS